MWKCLQGEKKNLYQNFCKLSVVLAHFYNIHTYKIKGYIQIVCEINQNDEKGKKAIALAKEILDREKTPRN